MSDHSKSSPLPTYFAVFIALLIGTGLTVYASGLDLGPFNGPVALTIATVKATLVALFFMHVKGASEKMTGVIVISGFFFLAILLTLSLADYMTRSWR